MMCFVENCWYLLLVVKENGWYGADQGRVMNYEYSK